ncbi:MAG: MBL fold metallo-hydrolase [Acidobacteriia bacterium]|nr:MBL fold metallo-hydrolase [Terriglobia bacterium]
MKLTFLGTRGEIEARTALHRMHSCLMVNERILVDCGADWLGKLKTLCPQAIILTHAHLDHAGGLKRGAPCPVYATSKTWDGLKRYPIRDQETIVLRQPVRIGDIKFEAFSVEHSLIAPAVGYRITAGGVAVFYVPDLVSIHERHEALSGIQLYIGDGTSIIRPILRRRAEVLIGHASVRNQLDWCRDERVSHAVITHCGSQIVKADARTATNRVQTLGRERSVQVAIAHDGLKLIVRRLEHA